MIRREKVVVLDQRREALVRELVGLAADLSRLTVDEAAAVGLTAHRRASLSDAFDVLAGELDDLGAALRAAR